MSIPMLCTISRNIITRLINKTQLKCVKTFYALKLHRLNNFPFLPLRRGETLRYLIFKVKSRAGASGTGFHRKLTLQFIFDNRPDYLQTEAVALHRAGIITAAVVGHADSRI